MAQTISILGIDIAKLVFHVVGMDDTGHVVLRKRMARGALLHCIARSPRRLSAWKPVGVPTTGPDRFARMATRCGCSPRNTWYRFGTGRTMIRMMHWP
jgi:hypothetical protein